MYIKRRLESTIQKFLFKNKVIVVYGPRQAGKTTMIKHLLGEFSSDEVKYIDCELLSNKDLLTRRSEQELFSFVKGYKIVVFDEAQIVKGIGSVLKILFDHMPEVQYIATGSSSFDLANEVSEPLTGRSLEFTLYPLALDEIAKNNFDAENELKTILRFGSYPGLINLSEEEKERNLNYLVNQYLYKNVLAIDGIKKPETMVAILKLLAFQIGNEVSFREIANKLSISTETVQKYINLLENSFVIFRLKSFSTNQRNEVTRGRKIYFVDLGLRNSLVDNFKPINILDRNDTGFMFENAMILERLKFLAHSGEFGFSQMFWRTTDQKEIDYIEEKRGGGKMAYEFKLKTESLIKAKKTFSELYPNISVNLVTPQNSLDFITA